MALPVPSFAAWELSVLEPGDSLGSVAALYGVDPVTLAEGNGVAPAPGRARTCVWGRGVELLALGGAPGAPAGTPLGFRRPVVEGSPNVCAPGLGFASFAGGQLLRLPPGGPRRAFLPVGKAAAKPASSGISRWWWWLGGAVVVVGGVAVVAMATAPKRKAA